MTSLHPFAHSVRAIVAVLAFLALGWTHPAFAESSADPLDTRISLDLIDVPYTTLFESFAKILQAELELDETLQGTLPRLGFTNITTRTALTAACEGIGCSWTLVAGRLRVRALDASRALDKSADSDLPCAEGLDCPLSLSLREAGSAEILKSFGAILGASLDLDPGLCCQGITLEIENEPLHEVLDKLCTQLECRWELREDPPTLAIRPRS